MGRLNNNLSQSDKLEGSLSPDLEITGELSAIDNVVAGEITIPVAASIEDYKGSYVAVSKPFEVTILETEGLRMAQDVTIEQIPYYETSNESGYTVYIGGE